MHKYRRSLYWITFGLVSIIIRLLSGPQLTEAWYSRGVYRLVRLAFDYGLVWVPVALLYLLVPALLIYLGWRIRNFIRLQAPRREKWVRAGVGTVAFLLGGIGLFLWLWGYNYGRQDVEDRLSLDTRPLSVDSLGLIVRTEARALADLRSRIPGVDTAALPDSVLPPDLPAALRPLVEATLRDYGYPVAGRVRGRILRPWGIFLRFGSAGLYFPFTGEGHVDGGLLRQQQVYTLAHELAHGYGFGDEGTCSFWAYLACLRASDPALAYTGRLGYWRTLAATYRFLQPDAYAALRDSLDPGMAADLDAINANLDQYPDIFPQFRYAAYDAYLKAQGIEEGMLNYNRVILLVEAWRRGR